MQSTAQVRVEVPGADWQLSIHTYEIEETEDMRDGLIAMIVIVALILSGGCGSGKRAWLCLSCMTSTYAHACVRAVRVWVWELG
eukprot:732412-Pelagomonas_calceolata.AAC.1